MDIFATNHGSDALAEGCKLAMKEEVCTKAMEGGEKSIKQKRAITKAFFFFFFFSDMVAFAVKEPFLNLLNMFS